ncbi:hypothetical protein PUN4_780090 [Paraburkholderia unamae]|nr:hypothetical protein PUN4_780090 [Paraburkholderia unamae]
MQRLRFEPDRHFRHARAREPYRHEPGRERRLGLAYRVEHRAATARAVRGGPVAAPRDRPLDRAQQGRAQVRRSGLDPARGVRRVFRGGERRALASHPAHGARRPARRERRAARARARHHDLHEQEARLLARRPDHHHFLRLEKEPRGRRADGEGDLRRERRGRGGAAAHAVPPDPADGVRGARPALGRTRHERRTRRERRRRVARRRERARRHGRAPLSGSGFPYPVSPVFLTGRRAIAAPLHGKLRQIAPDSASACPPPRLSLRPLPVPSRRRF